jgi:hypothetical protein
MEKSSKRSRRDFLKTTAIGAAGITLGTVGLKNSSAKGAAWTAGKQINPNIPNTRVVTCTDEKMITNIAKAKLATEFAGSNNQNTYIDAFQVESNMNSMARALTGKSSSTEAWSTIFMKPSGKEWSAVKAAIKVNCIYYHIMPKIPIVNKVCIELIRLGVVPANITIYDASYPPFDDEKYKSYIGKGLPSGIIVSAIAKDGVTVPVGSGSLKCCGVLAQDNAGTIVYPTDILINCAVNKGHEEKQGKITLCMKNHVGSLKYECPSPEELIAMNQCEAIIGGTNGSPCRQQLCIVDSLWAAVDGPGSAPTHLLCTISMGTLAPVVDYQVALKIRNDVMNAGPNQTVIDNWLTSFNINKGDLEWVVVPPAVTKRLNDASKPGNPSMEKFHVYLDNSSFHPASVSFDLPRKVQPESISVHDKKGKLIQRLENNDRLLALWNGNDQNGNKVSSGNYIVTVKAGALIQSAALTIVR